MLDRLADRLQPREPWPEPRVLLGRWLLGLPLVVLSSRTPHTFHVPWIVTCRTALVAYLGNSFLLLACWLGIPLTPRWLHRRYHRWLTAHGFVSRRNERRWPWRIPALAVGLTPTVYVIIEISRW